MTMRTTALLTCLSVLISTGTLFAEETRNKGGTDPDRNRTSYGGTISPHDEDRSMDKDRDEVGHCDINPTTPMCKDQTRRGGYRPRHCDINPNTPLCRGE